METEMKDSRDEFCHESLQDSETIAELLSSLQRGLAAGTLRFSDENHELTLKPSGLLNLTIRASGSSELNVVDVRVTWQGSKRDTVGKEIRISAK
jgi:amphi-Trp domain-containing protein